ncbi:hypothetical protein ABKN59_005930 [Abortiporus biennis]
MVLSSLLFYTHHLASFFKHIKQGSLSVSPRQGDINEEEVDHRALIKGMFSLISSRMWIFWRACWSGRARWKQKYSEPTQLLASPRTCFFPRDTHGISSSIFWFYVRAPLDGGIWFSRWLWGVRESWLFNGHCCQILPAVDSSFNLQLRPHS